MSNDSFPASARSMIEQCRTEGMTIAQRTLTAEMNSTGQDRQVILAELSDQLTVMEESSEYGLYRQTRSLSGLTGGDANRINIHLSKGQTLCGDTMNRAMARAVSCMEKNVSMGTIVACPTAGSCGIVPAAVLTAAERLHKDKPDMLMALLTASGVGMLISMNATVSGAEGGCQAECGAATAMAAAALVEMMDGTVEMAFDAAAIAIKTTLGLVCDPVAGLVEVPCIKRNASGVVNAMAIADMVMSGVSSKIPFDDCVEAMRSVGESMPVELKETAMGGLAATPEGMRIRKALGL